MSDERPAPPPQDPSGRSKRRSALETGFERWLDRQLHKIYDPVLDEGIPDDLACLLDGFDARTERPADAPATTPDQQPTAEPPARDLPVAGSAAGSVDVDAPVDPDAIPDTIEDKPDGEALGDARRERS